MRWLGQRWLLLLPALIAVSACGSQPAATTAAASQSFSPKGILLKIDNSALKDAHFAFTETLGDGTQGTGEGLLELQPIQAESQSLQISTLGVPVTLESIAIGNTIYHRRSSDATWTASPGRGELTNLDGATDMTLNGEEVTPQGKAWHLSGTNMLGNPFEIWIREKDSYPLKYTSHHTDDATKELMMFDRFNTGQKIAAPQASQVVTG